MRVALFPTIGVTLVLAGCDAADRALAPELLPPIGGVSAAVGATGHPIPISYWDAENHFDDVANGDNPGTPIGGVTFAPGWRGQAFRFDGTGEIEITHSTDLELADGNASLSIAAWVKPSLPLSDLFHFATVVSFNYACSEPAIGIHVTDPFWPFSPHPDGVLFGVRDDFAILYQVGAANVLQADTWHHVIGVRDGPADAIRLYIDGMLQVVSEDLSGTIKPLRNAAGQFVVASQNGGQVISSPDRIGSVPVACATKRFFEGLIDEVKVWDVALTDEQAKAEFIGDDEGPVTSATTASPNPVSVTTVIALDALVDDATTGATPIQAAEYSVDGGAFTDMIAEDGTFDEVTEGVGTTIPAFASPGVHELCVRGTDARGNTGSPDCVSVAVYDPAGGFVTGGGWITSPVGAYTANPVLTGKATFAFVSRYRKGASVPEGMTQFKFKAAGFAFDSESYDWLVVSGARAQYKGSGSINGLGDLGFLLTVIDGEVAGGGGVDRFRLRVWAKGSGGVIYDNQPGAPDGSDPTTELGGGSIVIHK